eukprot:11107239-Prorocentrum_lima.AAC.1
MASSKSMLELLAPRTMIVSFSRPVPSFSKTFSSAVPVTWASRPLPLTSCQVRPLSAKLVDV